MKDSPEDAGHRDPSSLNLRHLWAFCTVADAQSINRAVGLINLSQPAVSQAIGHLERDFGVDLFRRSATGMHPTVFGSLLRQRLERGFRGLAAALDPVAAQAGSEPRAVSPANLATGNQLTVLVAAVERGSVHGAARRLQITGKSVGRNLKQLEDRLGRSLLHREGELLRPTRLGSELVRATKLFNRELELAREEILAEQGITSGRLVVGALPLARSYIVPQAMIRIAREHPDVSVQLVEGPYDKLVAGILEGEIDVVVGAMRSPLRNLRLQQIKLFDETLCIVARSDHPCARRATNSLGDLMAYPWIAPRTGSPARRQFDELVAQGSDTPTVLLEMASHMAVRSVLIESDCLALISRHQIRYEELNGQLSVVNVSFPRATREVGCTVLTEWKPTGLQNWFIEELRRAADASLAGLPDLGEQ